MPAPFVPSKKTEEVKQIATEIKATINEQAAKWDGNGLLIIDLAVGCIGRGFRPHGDYGKGATREWGVSVSRQTWDGLSPNNMCELSRMLADIKGFEVKMGDYTASFGEWANPDFSFPCCFVKFGNGCDEFKELQKLVSKKYGIDLNPQDLYLVSMSRTIKNKEVGERTYVAYAPYRCKQLIEKIKSFGRKHTTCEIVTIDDFECGLECRAVWLDIQPKVKK